MSNHTSTVVLTIPGSHCWVQFGHSIVLFTLHIETVPIANAVLNRAGRVICASVNAIYVKGRILCCHLGLRVWCLCAGSRASSKHSLTDNCMPVVMIIVCREVSVVSVGMYALSLGQRGWGGGRGRFDRSDPGASAGGRQQFEEPRELSAGTLQ